MLAMRETPAVFQREMSALKALMTGVLRAAAHVCEVLKAPGSNEHLLGHNGGRDPVENNSPRQRREWRD